MKYYLIFLLSFIGMTTIAAQDITKSDVVTVVTNNNHFYTGLLINITKDSIFLNDSDIGEVGLNKENVISINEGIIPTYFSEKTNASAPYYVQTGIPNENGNHYYKNYFLFGNEFNFGMNDYVNFSFGFETFSLIFDDGPRFPIMQLGLKFATSITENLHVGFSSKYYFNNEGGGLWLESPITIGDDRFNFTLSPMYLYSEGDEQIGIGANLSVPMGSKMRFVIDYFYFDEVHVSPVVLEYQFKSGFVFSLGAILTSDGNIPNLAFSIPFGNWKKNYVGKK